MVEDEIADGREALLEHQIRRRLQKTRGRSQAVDKISKTRRRLDAAIRDIGGEIIQGL